MKINPNTECKAGKLYKLGFRTGVHKDKKKELKKMACRTIVKRSYSFVI